MLKAGADEAGGAADLPHPGGSPRTDATARPREGSLGGPKESGTLGLKPIRFGDFLLERAAITEGQLLDALADHWISGRRLGESIAHCGYLPSDEVERLAAEFQNLQTVYV